MVPVKELVSKIATRGLWAALGLFMCAADMGCSRLKSHRKAEPSPTIGRDRTGVDKYAAAPIARTLPIATQPGTSAAITDAELVSGLPTRASDDLSAPPVQLRVSAEAGSRGQEVDATRRGVPDGARSLESAETSSRRPADRVQAGRLVSEARASLDRLSTYQVAMRRQERVNGNLLPEEDVILSVRRDPLAIRLTWPEGPHKGREVLYRADEPGGRLHVNMADSALPVPRLSLAPDSPMVMKNSRHPLTEAGFDPVVRALEETRKVQGPTGLVYEGLRKVEPFDRPHHSLVRTTSSGETTRVFLDAVTHLPAQIITESAAGELLERYTFRDLRSNLPELANSDAFDPDTRWGPPRGLFGRLAGGKAAEISPESQEPPR